MDILSRRVLPADHRIAYGADPSQFGDLWLPEHGGPFPLVVFYHGGWWQSSYDLGYAGYLCDALKREGIATWSIEYRRVGFTGGGWPATFLDAAAGFRHVLSLAKTYSLDLKRVITMGHSAGGHLAFWIAGMHHIPADSEIFATPPGIQLRSTVALAGAVDLRLTVELAGALEFAHDRYGVFGLMGGSPQEYPKRYAAGNPGDLLPFQAPQFLIQGTEDSQIPPELPSRWVAMSKRIGSHATATIIPDAGHFDLVDPESKAWGTVMQQIKEAFKA